MKRIVRLLNMALLLLATGNSQADIILSFDPVAQDVTLGSPVDVALKISGLGSATPPSLSTFDLNISFDPGLLSFTSAAFGDPKLGDQLDVHGLGGNLISSGISSPGVLNVFELSLDSLGDLDTLQAASFTLATLTFNTVGIGSSALGITINSLGDANGAALASVTQNGSVTVSAVPLPAAWLLFASGMLVLVCPAWAKTCNLKRGCRKE